MIDRLRSARELFSGQKKKKRVSLYDAIGWENDVRTDKETAKKNREEQALNEKTQAKQEYLQFLNDTIGLWIEEVKDEFSIPATDIEQGAISISENKFVSDVVMWKTGRGIGKVHISGSNHVCRVQVYQYYDNGYGVGSGGYVEVRRDKTMKISLDRPGWRSELNIFLAHELSLFQDQKRREESRRQ